MIYQIFLQIMRIKLSLKIKGNILYFLPSLFFIGIGFYYLFCEHDIITFSILLILFILNFLFKNEIYSAVLGAPLLLFSIIMTFAINFSVFFSSKTVTTELIRTLSITIPICLLAIAMSILMFIPLIRRKKKQ